jgi:hypothetical protein
VSPDPEGLVDQLESIYYYRFIMRLARGDWCILFLCVFAVTVVSIYVYSHDFSPSMVTIESDGKSWVYPIETPRVVEVEGPLGTTVVEIADGMVRFKSSPCPDHVCMLRGWMKNPGEFAACLPNRVMATVGDYDE